MLLWSVTMGFNKTMREISEAVLSLTGSAFLFLSLSVFTNAADKKFNYDDHVRPIFADRCLSCHNPDKAKGGLDLTTYTSTMQGGSSGEIVSSGDPGASRLFLSVSHAEEPIMPPKGEKLSQDKLSLISSWISGGLLENSGSKAKTAKPSFNLALATTASGKPEGPPPMPEHLPLEPAATSIKAASPLDIASSPWAPIIAVAVPKQVILYNSQNLQISGILPFPEGTPTTLSFSRNGSILIAGGGRGGKSGLVVGWEVKSGKRVFEIGAEFDSVMAADITSDHSMVALGSPGRRIKIYATKNGEEIANIKKHTDWVTSLAFSPDGILLATGDRNGGLFVWESNTGNPFYTLKAHSKSITAISWRSDSNVVASSSEDGSIRLWEMNGGKQVKNWTGHGGGTLDMAFTGDGRIASCGRDKVAKVWDGNGTQKIATKAFPDIPVTACLSHDGKKIIVGDWKGEIKVFNTADGKLEGTILGNPPSIQDRIINAGKIAKDTSAKLTEAETVHTQNLASLKMHTEKIELAKNIHNEAQTNHDQSVAKLNATTDTLNKIIKEQAALNDKISASNETLKSLGTQISENTEDPSKVEQLKETLTRTTETIKGHQSELDKIKTKETEIITEASTAQQRVDASMAEMKAAKANLKSLSDESTKLDSSTKEAHTALKLVQADNHKSLGQIKYWEAQAFNLKRHQKITERTPLSDDLREATRAMNETQSIHDATSAETKSAEEALKGADNTVTQKQMELTIQTKKLPKLKGRLTLEQLLVKHGQSTVQSIREAMNDASDDIKGEFQSALEKEMALLIQDQAKVNKTQDLVDNSIPRAKASLEEAIANRNASEKALNIKTKARDSAMQKLTQALTSHGTANDKLSEFDKSLEKMFQEYLRMLPETL
ncbi:MAG: c-type cytochrome domain-containing protein [Verrucomicrobiales bacterium]